MAEIQSKRSRHDSEFEFDDSNSNSKRQKLYDNLLSLEEKIEHESSLEPGFDLSQDLSAIFTTLEQELSSDDSTTTFDFDSPPCMAAPEAEVSDCHHHSATAGDEDGSVESVMRHLLEASDDELGIPNGGDDYIFNDGAKFEFGFSDNGLWEFEDETANYYAVLQSELFM